MEEVKTNNTIQSTNPAEATPQKVSTKKVAAGWFTFTCCADSTIVMTELLNEHFDEWSKLVDFKHFNALKSKNDSSNLDIAFVEGAISSESQAKEVTQIRENSKYVIAIGSCACTGMPSASRNAFGDKVLTEEIKNHMDAFEYSKEVHKLSDVIKVDDMVNGCPMKPEDFINMLNKYLKIAGVLPE